MRIYIATKCWICKDARCKRRCRTLHAYTEETLNQHEWANFACVDGILLHWKSCNFIAYSAYTPTPKMCIHWAQTRQEESSALFEQWKYHFTFAHYFISLDANREPTTSHVVCTSIVTAGSLHTYSISCVTEKKARWDTVDRKTRNRLLEMHDTWWATIHSAASC